MDHAHKISICEKVKKFVIYILSWFWIARGNSSYVGVMLGNIQQ